MITKQELQAQIERLFGESLAGERVLDVLKSLPSECVVNWGNVPDAVVDSTFE